MNLIRPERKDWLDPFDLITDLHDNINQAFSNSLRRQKDDRWSQLFNPMMDLIEEENQYILKADVPGLEKDAIDITMTGNVLTLKGERKEESEKKSKNYYRLERQFGSFQRSIEFPTDVRGDQIKAGYKNGVLEITVPKAENAKPRQIRVDVQ